MINNRVQVPTSEHVSQIFGAMGSNVVPLKLNDSNIACLPRMHAHTMTFASRLGGTRQVSREKRSLEEIDARDGSAWDALLGLGSRVKGLGFRV